MRLLAFVAESGHRRDSALLSLALGTGLRLMELVGLSVGHVRAKMGVVVWRIDRRGSPRDAAEAWRSYPRGSGLS